MSDQTVTSLWLRGRTAAGRLRDRLAGEVGEGVISAAITVLIMALVGMWFGGLRAPRTRRSARVAA